ACRRASTFRHTSTLTSTSISMVSRSSSTGLLAVLAGLVAAPAAAQAPAAPAPLRLSFADAVSMAAGKTPVVELATLRTTEADARVRQARAAGVSPAIDVTRARAQLATAEGLLLVARNQLDRGRIDVARALGLDAATTLAFTDSLAPSLGAADVPVRRDSAVTAALANRPE